MITTAARLLLLLSASSGCAASCLLYSLPAFYIAVIGFHFEVLPVSLLLTVKGAVEKVPYPPLIEALIMELTIELIREAGIRLPSAIGPTIGIVGGLVIGDAIVKAGLVSNTMIVIVATTAIASYVVPSNEMSGAVRLFAVSHYDSRRNNGIHRHRILPDGTNNPLMYTGIVWDSLFCSGCSLPVERFEGFYYKSAYLVTQNRPLDPHPEKMKQRIRIKEVEEK